MEAEGNYLILPAGSTADELRSLFRPEAVDIWDLFGKQILHGRLGTGMTAGSWTLVILGDCDGTGLVSRADLQFAFLMALTPGYMDSPQARAADLNSDGIVDSADLLLFSSLIDP